MDGAGPGWRLWRVARTGAGAEAGVLHDAAGEAWQRYRAAPGTLVLVRPDGYVLARWPRFDLQALDDALRPFGLTARSTPAEVLHGQ